MKRASTFFMLLFFLALTLWLSFKVKSQRQELFQIKTTLAQNNNQNNLLSYQLSILQEAFALNFGLAHEPLLLPEVMISPGTSPMFVLYLKAHACSPCNMPVIRRLIEQGWQHDGFRIVSHPTNRHFLMQALSDDALNNPQKVTWLNHPLYANETTQYDAVACKPEWPYHRPAAPRTDEGRGLVCKFFGKALFSARNKVEQFIIS